MRVGSLRGTGCPLLQIFQSDAAALAKPEGHGELGSFALILRSVGALTPSTAAVSVWSRRPSGEDGSTEARTGLRCSM